MLVGQGEFFCSGGDLKQLATRHQLPPGQRREQLEGPHQSIRAIADCSKQVIAAVEGSALGAGLSITLACDLLVVARNVFFPWPTAESD